MDVREFDDLIDRLGEDISQWPDVQRRAAADLLAASPDAARLLSEARLIRQALSSAPVRAPSGLADRIVATAGRLAAEEATASPADVHQPG